MAPDLIPLLDAWAALAPGEILVWADGYILLAPGEFDEDPREGHDARPARVGDVSRPSLRRLTHRSRQMVRVVEAHARHCLTVASYEVETRSLPGPGTGEHHARARTGSGAWTESGPWELAALALVFVRVAVLEGA